MPLTWNAVEIPDNNRKHPLFEAAIWNTMSIGMGAITKKTLSEAILRTRIVEGVGGPYQFDANGRPMYLHEVLHLFVGLKTNVSNEPRTKWFNARTKNWMYDIERRLPAEEN